MAADLDALDLKILTHLLRDGRAPAQQVADSVGLSRPAVADRIARLERDGVIRGHTVVVEPKAVGRAVTAFIAARGQTLDAKRMKAFDAILKSPGADVATGGFGDGRLEFNPYSGEREVRRGGMLKVDAGAAADFEQTHWTLGRECALDGFGLKCLKNARGAGDKFPVLVGKGEELTTAEF